MTFSLKTRSKTINIVNLFLLLAFIFSFSFQIFNPMYSRAAGEPLLPYDQAKAYNAKYVLARCLTILNNAKDNDYTISLDNLSKGKVFRDIKDLQYVGPFFDGEDGKVNCTNDIELIFKNAGLPIDYLSFFVNDTGIFTQQGTANVFKYSFLNNEGNDNRLKRYADSIQKILYDLNSGSNSWLGQYAKYDEFIDNRLSFLDKEIKNSFYSDTALSNAAAYFMLRDNFMSTCLIQEVTTPVAGVKTETLKYINENTGNLEPKEIFYKTDKNDMRYGYGLPSWTGKQTYPGEMKCTEAFKFINDSAKSAEDDTKSAVAAGAKSTTNANINLTTEEKITCKKAIGFLGGWICSLLGFVDTAIQKLEGLILDQFKVDTIPFESGSTNIRPIWNNMARLASGLLVMVALIMIISTALGFNVVSAYTMKKVLPKIVIGSIGIWLSWTLVTGYISIMNTIGEGLQQFMFLAVDEDLSEFGLQTIMADFLASTGKVTKLETAVLFTGLAAGGITALSLPVILGLALTALIGIMTGVIVLGVRQLLIVVFLVFSPLAFAAWILPGTNKYWSKWFSILNKLLIMYPLFAVLFAAGKIVGNISLKAGNDIFSVALPIIAYLFPFFYLPKLFKSAGGVLNGVTGAVAGNKITKGWQGKIKSASDARNRRKDIEKGARQRQRQTTGKMFGVRVPGLKTASTASENFRRGERLLGKSDTKSRATYENIENARKNFAETGLENDSDVLEAIATGKPKNEAVKKRADKYMNDKHAQAAATQLLASRGNATQEMVSKMTTNFADDQTTAQRLARQAISESKNNGNLAVGSMEYDFGSGSVGYKNAAGVFHGYSESPTQEYNEAKSESIVRELASMSYEDRSRTLTKNTDFNTNEIGDKDKPKNPKNDLADALRTASGKRLVQEVLAPSRPGNPNNHQVTEQVREALRKL